MTRNLVLTLLMFAVSAGAQEPNWHRDAFFGLHYDLHPGEKDTELGRETTYEHIRAMLEKVKPDFVQYDCKGHAGWTGYPTEVGSPSPGIVNDALAIWRKVTRDLGIPLSIHYSGVWDTRAIELNPGWGRIDAGGNLDKNNTCRLSGYDAELMIPQLIEVVKRYDIDGMWIDGENWASRPCWCERCTAAFAAQSGMGAVPKGPSDSGWFEFLAFHRELFTRHVAAVVEAVHAVKPGCMVTSNWMYSVRQPDDVSAPIDYLSGDFDPSFGAERACAEARFIGGRGKPWDLMAWAFLRTGSLPWTFKPAPHLCQEISVVLAQGGSVFIYNQPQRSGRLTEWHQDILAETAAFARARREYCFQTETIPQIALLHSESSYYRRNDPLYNFGPANQAMEGALHALLECGYSVDILNESALAEKLDLYPAVVIPEAEHLPAALNDQLGAWVERGGRLLVSGAHVARQHGALAGVRENPGVVHGGYVPADNGAVSVAAGWQAVILEGAASLAPLLRQQEPALNAWDTPAATLNTVGAGRAAAIHGPVFHTYHQGHYPRLRRFIGDVISALDAPLMRHDGPWWVEMSARKKERRALIQFVNRGAAGHLAPNRHMVESVPNTGPFTVSIPIPERPTRCFLAPDPEGVEWTWRDGHLTVKLGGLSIHNVLVIE